jgi:hypothetical protein
MNPENLKARDRSFDLICQPQSNGHYRFVCLIFCRFLKVQMYHGRLCYALGRLAGGCDSVALLYGSRLGTSQISISSRLEFPGTGKMSWGDPLCDGDKGTVQVADE